MIEELRLRDLGVIADAALELDPGFTVVTGETGAGKTMVVTALGLLLGARADAGAVRTGATRAVVEGRVRVDPDGPVARRVAEAGGALDDDTLLLARTVGSEGRSRAHVGGVSAPVGVLAELGDALVAVHGQSDQHRLLHPARVLALLDRFAGHDELLAEVAAAHRQWRTTLLTLQTLQAEVDARVLEAAALRADLDDVRAVDPQPGEDRDLRLEQARLAHADDLQRAAATAAAALAADDGPDAATALGVAWRALDAVREHDPDLAALADRAAEVQILAADLASDLAAYATAADTDPLRLAVVGERRAQLAGLTRRHGPTVDDLLAWAQRAGQRLADLDGTDAQLSELTSELEQARGSLAAAGLALHRSRAAAADRLGAAVTHELAALAMPDAVVELALAVRDDDAGVPWGDGRCVQVGESGADHAELLLLPHPGAPARPVARAASGGELSRVMLAIEVVLAGVDPVPTFVFDEVDAGVGGRAAVEVGRRLARLAHDAQVLVVTHLPQVAAFADRHLVVAKDSDGAVTTSGVTVLDDAGRARELARMLAGLEDSDLGRGHAAELLELAAAERAAPRSR